MWLGYIWIFLDISWISSGISFLDMSGKISYFAERYARDILSYPDISNDIQRYPTISRDIQMGRTPRWRPWRQEIASLLCVCRYHEKHISHGQCVQSVMLEAESFAESSPLDLWAVCESWSRSSGCAHWDGVRLRGPDKQDSPEHVWLGTLLEPEQGECRGPIRVTDGTGGRRWLLLDLLGLHSVWWVLLRDGLF